MNSMFRFAIVVLSCFVLMACEPASHQDIVDFIEQTKRTPPGKLKPLPVYAPYKPHSYDSAGLRSPFEPPAVIKQKALAAKSNVKPDLTRPKQRLEQFEFSSLTLVGSIKKEGIIWGLIRDPEGSIERVREGYYVGKNHGRIVKLTEQQADVIEIVPNGVDGWLERPNAILIQSKE